MKKFTAICLGVMAAAWTFVACNSSTTPSLPYTSSNVAISSFKLAKDDSILANLDTVFFSIDLEKSLIFNADSLPYGTPVNKFVPKIVTMDAVSSLSLTEHLADGKTEVHNYAENAGDTLDFTNPVTMEVRSLDGTVTRTYTISVNVHQEKTDSLVWNRAALRPLPTNLPRVISQRTVQSGEKLYCLTSAGSSYCMAVTDNPYNDDWTYTTPALPSGASIESFSATDNALFILASDGVRTDMPLYTSTDGGRSWTNTGERWTSVYGSMGDCLTGARNTGSQWYAVQYPAKTPQLLDSDMPVRGTSPAITFTTPMASGSQLLIVGGRKANGSLSNATWAFDGNTWADITQTPLAHPVEGLTVVPFFIYRTNSAFIATEYSILLAYGGRDASLLNPTVYLSYDLGMNWSKAPELMQLPPDFPMVSGAQAFVYDGTLGARSSASWNEIATSYRLPACAIFAGNQPYAPMSITPVTTWECPFIFTFGGTLANGTLSDTIWRATLNRLVFKPII